MRIRVIIVALLCSFSCACHSDFDIDFDADPTRVMGPHTYRFGATTNGSTWWWEVSFEDIRDTPDWEPGSDPPLPVSQAIQLAQEQVPKYTTTPQAYLLDTVEWLHIGNHMDDERKWIYIVNFERQREFDGHRFPARGTLRIPVLLDGRVVDGTKE